MEDAKEERGLEINKTLDDGVLDSNRPREEWDISHVQSTIEN